MELMGERSRKKSGELSRLYRRYEVRHETIYEYSQAIEQSEHWLRLRPVHDEVQNLESWDITFAPATPELFYKDCFDNSVAYYHVQTAYQSLKIGGRSRVIVKPHPIPERIPYLGLGSYLPSEIEMLAPYRVPDALPESQLRELAHYAYDIAHKAPQHALPLLLDSMAFRIFQDFTYTPGLTHVNSTAYEVLCLKRGVCQDFSMLMINLLRLLHIPARYRTGYLYTGGQQSQMADASHAWVEVFLPRAGWFGWDPTLGRRVGPEHIRLACGRKAADATPTAGTLYGQSASETLRARVSVSLLDEVSYDF